MTYRNQWPAGANDQTGTPLHSPTGKGKSATDGRRPIQTSKPSVKGGTQ